MRSKIKIQGEREFSTRSTTTCESTTFYQKAERVETYIHNKLKQMGVKPEIKLNHNGKE